MYEMYTAVTAALPHSCFNDYKINNRKEIEMKLDVIVPCYNAAATLSRAVQSCLKQPEMSTLWLIDDASNDDTWVQIVAWQKKFPQRIRAQRLPENSGVAQARNWGALQSAADVVAFLDADDEYQDGALAAAYWCFQHIDYLGLIRLRLQAVGLPERYRQQPNFAREWQRLAMTVGGNTVFRRVFLLSCGGFPQDALFRQLGGEDGALGLATVRSSVVGTLFDDTEPAVLHYWHDGIHAQRLLNAYLFGINDACVSPEKITQAQLVTEQISVQLGCLKSVLSVPQCGVLPLHVNEVNT